jgi:hypothetical protein
MRGLKIGPTVAILSTSGMIRVSISAKFYLGTTRSFSAGHGSFCRTSLFSLGGVAVLATYHFAWVLASTLVTFIYRTLGEETMEINSQKVAISKGFHGWERMREYEIRSLSGARVERTF